MSYQTRFPELLKIAERDGEGGMAAEPPAIILGEASVLQFALPAHPVYGDWTGGAFSAPLRAAPGAVGDPLAEYACVTGTPAGLLTTVTMTLLPDDQDALPPPNPVNGLAEVFLSLRFTPTGGAPDTIVTTRQLVRGAI